MLVEKRLIIRNEEEHLIHTEETYDLPASSIAKSFIFQIKTQVQTYWCSEMLGAKSEGCFFIVRNGKEGFDEAFVVVPVPKYSLEAETECFIYFISDMNLVRGFPLGSDESKLHRMSILASFADSYTMIRENSLKIDDVDIKSESDVDSIKELREGPEEKDGMRKVKENTSNIIVKPGQRLGISSRFPGYFRLENGLLWCHN